MTTVSSVDIGASTITTSGLTTTGTITSGVWHSTPIGVQYGGTGAGAGTWSPYGVMCAGTTTNAVFQQVGTGSGNDLPGNVLSLGGNGAAPLPQWILIPGRNRLINGDMQIWQRLTSGSLGAAVVSVAASTTAYTADRWQLLTGANQACTVSQIAQGAGNAGGNYWARVQRTNGQTGTGVIRFCQSLTIDQSYGSALGPGGGDGGYFWVLSALAQCGAGFTSASKHLTWTVYAGTGSTNKSGINGAFTGNTVVGTGTFTLASGTPTVYTSGNGNIGSGTQFTQFAVEFSYTPVGTAGATDSFDISDIQLEFSSNAASPFDRKSYTEQLLNCQRFYQKSFPYTTPAAQNSGTYVGALVYTAQIASTTAGYTDMCFLPVNMLTATAPTFYSPSASSAKWYNITGGAESGTAAALYSGANNFAVNNPQVVGDLVAQNIAVHWAIDADLT